MSNRDHSKTRELSMRVRVNGRLAPAAILLLTSSWVLVAAAAKAADAMPGAPEEELITGSALKGGDLVDDPTAFQGKATAGRKVECFLDEYNVKWSWEPMERRHGNAVGAVFQACLLRRLGMVGLDGVMVWHTVGGAYGLAEPQPWDKANPLKIRLTGRLYQIGSRCVTGPMADTAVDGDRDIELIAVTRSDGVRSVLLINRANHTVVVSGADKLGVGSGKDSPTMMRIISDGLSSLQWKRELAGDAVRLPGYSVTLVTGDGSVAKVVQEPNRGG
jgi:hypothetical protein